MGSTTETKRVVLLVDNKQRDLLADTLIAHHLLALGVDCRLEPLEAYRGVLAAWRPAMIIFNHLTASHLATYSRRLAEMGVLAVVLTNEGITYDRDLLNFIVGNHHRNAHIDAFLCWNGELKGAMGELGVFPETRKEIVGIPRFDFYCRPWSQLFHEPRPGGGLPRVLVCADFWYADYWDKPEAAEVSFGMLKGRLPAFDDYKTLVEIHHHSRLAALEFFTELAKTQRWELIVRPHPCEQADAYRAWLEGLPTDWQRNVRLDSQSNITGAILNADLVISCETCTTALEAWIAKKPSIELTFARHPVFFHEELARHQPLCDRPQDLPGVVEEALAHPDQSEFLAGRQAHLRKWCHTIDGNSCQLVANTVQRALVDHPSPDWSRLTASDYRRALKLKLTRAMGEAYHYDPLMGLKHFLAPKRYAVKRFAYEKSIKPSDVAEARRQLATVLPAGVKGV